MVPRERWDLAGAVPLLRQAVEAERAGLGQLTAALTELKVDPLPHVGGGAPASSVVRGEESARTTDGEVWLEGLKWFPSWMTLPGCLVACSRSLGMDNSPDWVYGATAFAFALNVHRTLCPSGPTAWDDRACTSLARNLGLRVEYLIADNGGGQLAQKQEEFFGRVSQAIDAGLPVIGWEMEVPDYYVVHGYDAEGSYLFRDFGGSVGRVNKTKLGDTGIGILKLMIVPPQAPADDRTTVRLALTIALEIAAGKPRHGGEYTMGLAGYDQWIKALEQPEAVLADENAAYGLAYNAACWSDCRSHAPGFLLEAQKRLNDPSLDADFKAAIASYQKVAAGMERVHGLFPAEHEQKPETAERLRDAALRAQALEALRSARAAEAEGLRSLAALLEKLGGPKVDVAAIIAPRRDPPGEGAAGRRRGQRIRARHRGAAGRRRHARRLRAADGALRRGLHRTGGHRAPLGGQARRRLVAAGHVGPGDAARVPGPRVRPRVAGGRPAGHGPERRK